MTSVLGRTTAVLLLAGLLLVPAVTATPAWSQVERMPVQLTAAAEAGAGAGEVFDVATLTGGNDPTGTVLFQLFGPHDDTCSGPPAFTSVKPVVGAGPEPVTVVSDHVLLAAPGVYRWVASYSGDALHAPAGPTDCLDPDQAVGVGGSSFSFAAQASPATTVGGTISDAATITTSGVPTGTMTFRLYGPEAPSCTGTPVFTWTMPVGGNGTYVSGAYTPTRPGVYRWVAAYSGDAEHPSAESSCLDPAQQVEVAPAAAPSYPCAVLAQQRAMLDGRLRALQQSLAAGFDPAMAALVHDAVTSAWNDRLRTVTERVACG